MPPWTQWTWVWVSSGSWWWTRKSGVLQSVGSQQVGHNWATELTSLVELLTESWGNKNPYTVCEYTYYIHVLFSCSVMSNLCISAYIEYTSFFLIICEQVTVFPLCISERFSPGLWKQMLFTYSAYVYSSVSKAHQLQNLPWLWYFLFYLNVHFLEDWLDSLWTQSKESLKVSATPLFLNLCSDLVF